MTYKPTPFSHSSLKSFETCAFRHQQEKVLKRFPFTDTVHTIYGKEVHKAVEEYGRDGVAMPKKFEFVKPVVDAFLAKPGRKY